MSEHYDGNLQVILPTDAPCIEYTRHLFLTGRKGVGKSTLVRRFLEREDRTVGGFYTLKTEQAFPGRPSVHLLRAGKDRVPDWENLLLFCDREKDDTTTERFDWLGCQALDESRDAKLLIMDELGPHEENAERFKVAVLEALDGNVPILGILQQADSDFLRMVAEHPQVTVLEVTQENREHLLQVLNHWRHYRRDSYGAVVFEKTPAGPMVLMIRSFHGWSFPKGMAEMGETPLETAVREIWEETGIHAKLNPYFSCVVPSVLPGDERTVTFFLGSSQDGLKPPVADEVPDAAWVPAMEAEARIAIPTDRAVFNAAWNAWSQEL